MKKIVFAFICVLFIHKVYAQDVHILYEREVNKMGISKYTNMILKRANPIGYYETLFSYYGTAFDGTFTCTFYTVNKNVFTVIPISQVSQMYPNALSHAWLANYMQTTPINTAIMYLNGLPNIYIIEMLPAQGVAHIYKVKYITPYY